MDDNRDPRNEVYEYEIDNKSWSVVGHMQRLRSRHAVSAVKTEDIVDYCVEIPTTTTPMTTTTTITTTTTPAFETTTTTTNITTTTFTTTTTTARPTDTSSASPTMPTTTTNSTPNHESGKIFIELISIKFIQCFF